MNYPAILDEAWQQHLAPRAANAPTVISTFAGCGGSSLGYSMAGFRELLAVEWDNNAVEIFKLNFPSVPVYHGDIAKLSVDEALRTTNLQVGELDVLDGSPPCQGFSTAGKREMSDSRNYLFREYARLLKGLQPKVFIMENVSGMIKGKMKLIFAEILRELKACGYQVKAWLLNAKWFDVPQSRERVIFVGAREDLRVELHCIDSSSSLISVAQALNMSDDIADKQYRHSYSTGGKVSLATSTFNKPCLTITKAVAFSVKRYGDRIASLRKPVGAITKVGRWFLNDKEEFSLAAYQRLASFPDRFIFTDFSNAKAGIGNAVPPLFMRAIATHIRQTILDKNTDNKYIAA